jgi:hypothetical protein
MSLFYLNDDIEYVMRKTTEIYKAYMADNTAIRDEDVYCDIAKNEEEQNNIRNDLYTIDCAWMEMEYYGNSNPEYYDNFANDSGESALLKESDYVIFYLGKNCVDTLNGNRNRRWIYEAELSQLKEKLLNKRKKLQSILIDSQVSVGIAIAKMKMY